MSIGAVNYGVYSNNLSFQSKKCADKSACDSPKPKKTGNIGKAIASALCPGLGQVCDNRVGSGLKHFGGFLGLAALSKIAPIGGFMAKSTAGRVAGFAIGLASGIGAFATYVHGIVDAYKGKKIA